MVNFIIGICFGFSIGWLMATMLLSHLEKVYQKEKKERELRETVRELNSKIDWLLKDRRED